MKKKLLIAGLSLLGLTCLKGSLYGQEMHSSKQPDSHLVLKKVALPGQGIVDSVHVDRYGNTLVMGGDMIIDSSQINITISSATFLETNKGLWPNGIVPYTPFGDHPERATITAAINYFNEKTNIVFRPKIPADKNYVQFKLSSGSSANLGMLNNKPNTISIATGAPKGTVMHEILHCLGFYHEHQRKDRDTYVWIDFDNIREGNEHNYDMESKSRNSPNYDFGSVMHYQHTGGFAKDPSKKIIYVLGPHPNLDIGQRDSLSNTDLVILYGLYPTDNGNYMHLKFINKQSGLPYKRQRITVWNLNSKVTDPYRDDYYFEKQYAKFDKHFSGKFLPKYQDDTTYVSDQLTDANGYIRLPTDNFLRRGYRLQKNTLTDYHDPSREDKIETSYQNFTDVPDFYFKVHSESDVQLRNGISTLTIPNGYFLNFSRKSLGTVDDPVLIKL